jgi:hypothetical protein
VLDRRLRRLENRFHPRESAESIIAAQIRERRRLRIEKEGRPVEEERSREDVRGLTLAQAIRKCRSAALERMVKTRATEG